MADINTKIPRSYFLILILSIFAAYIISIFLRIFVVIYQGHYGVAELGQAREYLVIIAITVFITAVFAITAVYFRNLLKFFFLFYSAISILAGIILILIFSACTGLCPGGLFIAPIAIVMSQFPNILMIHFLQNKPKLSVGILSICYSMILVLVPLMLYVYTSKTLPAVSERNFSNDLANIGFSVFEPSYLPEGFTLSRSDISGSSYSSLYCHSEKISNSLPCFRIIQSGSTYEFQKYENVGEPVLINNLQGYMDKTVIDTRVVWRLGSTTIELRVDKPAQNKISLDEILKIAESTTIKI